MSITAVIVAADPGYLEHTLAAVAAQQLRPGRIILADASPDGAGAQLAEAAARAGIDELVEIHSAGGARNFGVAVGRALAAAPQGSAEWLWLLHDDSPPEPEALAELVRATASARAVGIAGCKQVDFDEPSRLVSVGVRYTRAGRRIAEIEPGEIDQGQYDAREDVFAVGTAGMFIRAATWDRLGGLDPALGPFLDGAEFSRRARLAGERVIVVPTAKVRHARAALWHGPRRERASIDGANSFLARRVSTLHFRLVSTNLWGLLFVALAMLVAAPIRALWRVAANDLALAWQELQAPLVALGRVGDLYRSRRAIARASRTNRGVLAPLRATRAEVWRIWWHRWRAGRVERRRRVAPSELEIAERRTITKRRRVTMVLVLLALAAANALILPRVFEGSVFDVPALAGGGLSGVDQSYLELWQRALAGWSPTGDGAPTPPHPFGVVLAALATIVGGPLGVESHAAISLILALAIPLAGLSAWFAAGGFTRSVGLRAWSALTWAFVPVLATGINHGRIPALVAHILLPLFALALTRTFGVNQRDVIRSGMEDAGEGSTAARIPVLSRPSGAPSSGAAAAAGLLLAAICASTPILLPALAIALLVVAFTAARGRARLLIVALPTAVLFTPHFSHASHHGWLSALTSIEQTPINLTQFTAVDAGAVETLPWYVLSGWPALPDALMLAAGAGALVVLVAVVGLFRGGVAGRAARWGWFVGGLGVLTAVLSQHVLRSPQYDWLGSFQRLPEWAGPGASLGAGGMIVAAAAAVVGVRQQLAARSLGFGHAGVALLVLALVAVMGAGGVNTTLALLQEPQWQVRGVEPLPALARQTLSGSERSRVLMLAPTEGTVVAELWRSNGPQLMDPPWSGLPDDPAREDLRELVAQMSTGVVADAPERLAEHAISFVLIPSEQSAQAEFDPFSREELVAALDGIAALERITENETGTLWRVAANTARVRIVQGEAETAVASDLVSAAAQVPDLPSDDAGILVLAERADPRWRASLDGEALRTVESGWQQSFELPAGADGQLRLEYAPLMHRVWRVALIAVLGFTLVLSLPVRRRAEVVA